MYYVILSLLILDAVLLATVVLLQAGQGGGLASLGGATTDSVLGSRQSVTLLTRMSWWCGGAFLVLSLLLSLMSSGTQVGTSDLQQRLRTSPPPASTAPSPLPITPAPGTAPGTAAPTTQAPASGAAKTPPAVAPRSRPAQ